MYDFHTNEPREMTMADEDFEDFELEDDEFEDLDFDEEDIDDLEDFVLDDLE